MHLSKYVLIAMLTVPLSGCLKFGVKSAPDMHVPSVLVTKFDSVPSQVNTKKEIQSYMVHTIKLCRKRARQLSEFQAEFNSSLRK